MRYPIGRTAGQHVPIATCLKALRWEIPIALYDLIGETLVVIGNGTSRQEYDLERIPSHVTTIGCNALHRDYLPNILVALDGGPKNILWELVAHTPESVPKITEYPTGSMPLAKKMRESSIAMMIPEEIVKGLGSSSGTTALAVGLLCDPIKVYLVGFDGAAGDQVYTGSTCYGTQVMPESVRAGWANASEAIIRTLDYTSFEVHQVGPHSIPSASSITFDEMIERFGNGH